MKKVLPVVGVLVVGLLAFLGFASTKPDTFSLSRSATLKAPPSVVYGLVSNFKQWPSWSPWAAMDPNQKTTFSGPDAAAGSVYAWVGNDKVGEGQMTIEGVKPDQEVAIKLQFIKPFAATNKTVFTLAPEAGGTKVTWTMSGDANLMSKVMQIFMPMDKMVGPDFEKGLAKMGTVAEDAAKKQAELEAQAKAAAEAAAKVAADALAAQQADAGTP